MTHPRQTIREALTAVLKTALPELARRIHWHRAIPLAKGRLPALLVYTRGERIDEAYAADPGARRRILTLGIEIVASGDAALDAVDALCARIEAALEAQETLGDLVEGLRIVSTEVEQDGDSDTPVLAARLTVEVIYWTAWQTPDEGTRPSLVLFSIAPQIGRAHEDKYVPIG